MEFECDLFQGIVFYVSRIKGTKNQFLKKKEEIKKEWIHPRIKEYLAITASVVLL